MKQHHKQPPSLLERWVKLIWGSDYDPDLEPQSAEDLEAPRPRRLGFGWKVGMALGLGIIPRSKAADDEDRILRP